MPELQRLAIWVFIPVVVVADACHWYPLVLLLGEMSGRPAIVFIFFFGGGDFFWQPHPSATTRSLPTAAIQGPSATTRSLLVAARVPRHLLLFPVSMATALALHIVFRGMSSVFAVLHVVFVAAPAWTHGYLPGMSAVSTQKGKVVWLPCLVGWSVVGGILRSKCLFVVEL